MHEPPLFREIRIREQVLWVSLAVLATLVMLAGRDRISGAHVALTYLLIVLGASARGGRGLAMALAFLCFVAFNFFFIPPYYTLMIHQPLDWIVLFAFLLTSAVSTQLLHRSHNQTVAARQRAAEVERLAMLGAETLSSGRAEDAIAAVAQVIQTELGLQRCEIFDLRGGGSNRPLVSAGRADGEGPGVEAPSPVSLRRASEGLAVAERPDGSEVFARPAGRQSAIALVMSAPASSVLIPLVVRERVMGVLRLADTRGIVLDAAQQRFAESLAYYAALGLERVELTSAARHAEALREADRLKDALLASVSHDLRTPLTTIKAMAHDLAEEGDDRAVTIEEEADRLNRFVSDLLDLSKLNAGAEPLDLDLIAAEDVLGAALQRISGVAAGDRLQVSLEGDPLLIGRIDFVSTLRALVNLIENALKYSAPAPVEVTAKRSGAWLVFEVADRGPGVAANERERIFEPFYRSRLADDTGGTGLGLPIARRSAEIQGGSIEYTARAGGGSVFALRLPAATEADLAAIS